MEGDGDASAGDGSGSDGGKTDSSDGSGTGGSSTCGSRFCCGSDFGSSGGSLTVEAQTSAADVEGLAMGASSSQVGD